ncbi:hypothetical protein QE152_g36745 [Popillia japonica]|uniref:Uncharacterized protein n=1 Tax=Popillia japonica TaxID=7064 RepID=A0AAW1ICY3_POPJA
MGGRVRNGRRHRRSAEVPGQAACLSAVNQQTRNPELCGPDTLTITTLQGLRNGDSENFGTPKTLSGSETKFLIWRYTVLGQCKLNFRIALVLFALITFKIRGIFRRR